MSPEDAAMADDAARSRLGRGLASLIGDVGAESQSNERVSRRAHHRTATHTPVGTLCFAHPTIDSERNLKILIPE